MEPSIYQHQEIMDAVTKTQGDLAAIVILQQPDGSTTYLRHNITGEQVASMMRQAYCHSSQP
jgi:hypothetical protein